MLKVYIEKINEIKGIRYLRTHRERMWGEKGAETEWHTPREMETEVRKATHSPST